MPDQTIEELIERAVVLGGLRGLQELRDRAEKKMGELGARLGPGHTVVPAPEHRSQAKKKSGKRRPQSPEHTENIRQAALDRWKKKRAGAPAIDNTNLKKGELPPEPVGKESIFADAAETPKAESA